jgi:CRP-like cAMP-binding protein
LIVYSGNDSRLNFFFPYVGYSTDMPFLTCYISLSFHDAGIIMPRLTNDPFLSENQILAALPGREQERLLPQLERVTLQSGQQLYESGQSIDYAYFPESALISLLSVSEAGATVEAGLVGNEGMVGRPIFLRSKTMPFQTIVQSQARLCRWLLAAQDRIKSCELQFTQESLSQMLETDRTSH